ncbi:MAGE domain-containing protein [Mycena indigotica]|uniref:MAGE domain-containing protein n=1 Tax=Mycena indigotica TaxID=2126181 RepID=A0A8H6SH58_9AGAR|nr:MAGE domain-containing protein [Mycena indigotica]KAF7298807.1 MAGE domain-containing protein [Mycena indigotica]
MARGSTTRSQKAPKASQAQASQPRRSQKQRPAEESEDEQDDDQEDDDNMEVDQELDDGQNDEKRMVHELVRLAMFNEHRRMPLRREEISKKVLGSNTRAFARVFAAAQDILQNILGMRLVELRTRAELDPDKEKLNDGEEARNAAGVKRKAAAAGSKTYILRSTLSDELIEAMAVTHEEILEDEAEDAPSEDDEEEQYSAKNYGTMLAWSKGDQLAPLGILYVILALILVSGRVVGDQELRVMLKRLNLSGTTNIPFTAASTHPGNALTLDNYLTQLMRQGYIDRAQVGAGADGKKATNKGKRGRVAAADEEAGITYEWRWGPRAASEVGEKAVAKFVAEFMVAQHGQPGDDDDGEENSGAARVRAQKKQTDAEAQMDKMLTGVARAAGGELADIK